MGQVRVKHHRRVSRFRDSAARARFHEAYDAAVAAWPIPTAPVDVSTEFGATHVNSCGTSDGTPIVLLHSMLGTSTSWLPNVAALGARHPVYAVDTICDAGRSVQAQPIRNGVDLASWVDDVLAGLELDRAHLVGLSYGAALALNQAVRSPRRVASVTAIEPPGAITRGTVGIIWEMIRAGVTRSDPAFDRLTRLLGNGEPPPEPIFAVMRCGFHGFKVAQPFLKRFDDEQLRSIKTPVLLLFGERSPMGDAGRAVARARRLLPEVQAEIVPGTGHTPPIENPPLLNRRILDFVDGVDGSTE